jgi:hypothetical protein
MVGFLRVEYILLKKREFKYFLQKILTKNKFNNYLSTNFYKIVKKNDSVNLGR